MALALGFVLVFFSPGALAVGGATPACGADEAAIAGDCRPVSEIAGELRRIVESGMDELDLTAVVVNVRIGDVPVLRDAFGTSMTGVPATPDMHFRNGAIAIAYLTTTLLRMNEDGLLGLDDRLSRWFPDYPRADDITPRMLATSTSGYADYVDLDLLPLHDEPFRHYRPDELIGIAFGKEMKCDPGACFAYAHTNFVILGEVLRKVSGRPLEELIAHYVLDPLGLENTRSSDTPEIQEPVLHAFTAERGVFEDSTYWNPSWTLARGAVMTTDIDDTLASAVAVGTGSLLSPQSRALQIAQGSDGIGRLADNVHYAMGVIVADGWIMQTPSFAGYAAVMAYLPEARIAVAIASTNGAGTPDAPSPNTVLFSAIRDYLAPGDAPPTTR